MVQGSLPAPDSIIRRWTMKLDARKSAELAVFVALGITIVVGLAVVGVL
jgi:hypothetical protein